MNQVPLGFLRQLFSEMPHDRTFTAKQLFDIFDELEPLMTGEQARGLLQQFEKEAIKQLEK